MQGTGQESEHNFRRLIPGNIETVRQGLAQALEQLNYVVLTENPLHAKRSAQKNILTANVLEYGSKLTIGLKSISPTSTLATFDYTVPYIFSKGDRLALEREGEALLGLAMAPLRSAFCPSCGTENAGDVRFCRVCGTPLAKTSQTSEIELMRLTAAASGAYIEVGWGIGTLFINLIISCLLLFFGGPKQVTVGKGFLLFGSAISFFFLLFAYFRLRNSLNQPAGSQPEQPLSLPRPSISQQNTGALPAPPASVTERTTELIKQSAESRESGESRESRESA